MVGHSRSLAKGLGTVNFSCLLRQRRDCGAERLKGCREVREKQDQILGRDEREEPRRNFFSHRGEFPRCAAGRYARVGRSPADADVPKRVR
jgi:hypothetical protein